MKLIEIDQRSEEWLDWRAGGIGGSDIASIIGISPWVTREQLMLERLGKFKREENYAMRKGQRLEPMALMLANKKLGRRFVPQCVQHDDCDWMRVSLDGLDWDNQSLLEIKWPNWGSHEMALEGIVPPYYRPQVQWQLLTSGLDVAYYSSHSMAMRFAEADKHVILTVRPDAGVQAELHEAAQLFWEELQQRFEGVLV